MLKTTKIWVLLAGVFTVLIYYGLNHWLVLKDIQLQLKQDAIWEGSAKEVEAFLSLKLEKFIGKKMWQVSLKDLRQVAQSEPRVGEVQVLRRLPNRFFLQIHARKPLLVWLNTKEDSIHPLSREGQILPALPLHRIPDLPILKGALFLTDKNIRKQAIRFIQLLPEQGAFSRSAVSEIKYSAPEKSLIFILSANGKPVKISPKALPVQIKRVESVLRYLDQKNIPWRVIDARFAQKIVVSTARPVYAGI